MKTTRSKFSEKLKNFDFNSKLKVCSIISIALILIGILIISIFGFNLGIDFTGGTVLNVKVGSVLEEGNNYTVISNQISDIIEDNGFKVGYVQQEGIGAEAQVTVRFQDKKGLTEEQMQNSLDELKTEIEGNITLNGTNLTVEVSNGSRIAASASKTLLINSILAILIAVILILIYIAIRFELLSGLTAFLRLKHDVLIINNVIIIFDRIRENKKNENLKDETSKSLVNMSIKQVIKRTLLTALTTFVSIFMLTILGVSSIKEFLIPILFGLVSGVYSSTMLAGPIWAFINDKTVSSKK